MHTEAEYDAFVKRTEDTYPKMFATPYGGFAVSAGWWPILEKLCDNIQSHIDSKNNLRSRLLANNEYDHTIPDQVSQVEVHQIKEKFGGLRFYYSGGDAEISGMVRMAESWAEIACEQCGAIGQRRSGGWIRTLCDTHEAEYQERKKAKQ
jgi:hypothetical protein